MQRHDEDKAPEGTPPLPKNIWGIIFSFFTRADQGRGVAQANKEFTKVIAGSDKFFADKFKRCFPEEYEKIICGSRYCEAWRVKDWEAECDAVEREASEGLTENGRNLLTVLKQKDMSELQKFLRDHVISLQDLSFQTDDQIDAANQQYRVLPPLPEIVCYRTDKVAPLLWASLYGFPAGCQELYSRVIIPACEGNPESLLRFAIRSGQGKDEIERCYRVLSGSLRKQYLDGSTEDPAKKKRKMEEYLESLDRIQVSCMVDACRSGNSEAALYFFLKNKNREQNVHLINNLSQKLQSSAELYAFAKVYCDLVKKLGNYFQWDGNPLVHACDRGSLGAARYYLKNIDKIDVNAVSAMNRLPLIDACVNGGVAMADLLCEHGAEVNVVLQPDKASPTNTNLLQLDLRNKPCTPLLVACSRENLPCIRFLVAKNANVNQLVGELTPLSVSCFRNNLEIARCLLGNGAVVDPAMVAKVSASSCLPMLELLAELGADFSNIKLDPAFERHTVYGDEPMPAIQFLFAKGAVLDDPNEALRHSCMNLERNLVEFLLEHYQPDVNMRIDGRSLLEDVLSRGDSLIGRLLIINGANTDMLTPEQITDFGLEDAIAESKVKGVSIKGKR